MTDWWRDDRRELYEQAKEPPWPHCAHDFGDDGWRRRGAMGRWCHMAPTANTEFCAHHDPNRLTKSQRIARQVAEQAEQRAVKVQLNQAEAAFVAWWFAKCGGAEAFDAFAKEGGVNDADLQFLAIDPDKVYAPGIGGEVCPVR